MKSRCFMLDTDILVFMLRGLKAANVNAESRRIAERVRGCIENALREGATVCLSVVTVCELEYGARKSADPEKTRRALYKILAPFERSEAEAVELPRHYGEIRSELEQNGARIGAMDLMIAAHSRALGATLVTNNIKEFSRVKGLRIVNWAAP